MSSSKHSRHTPSPSSPQSHHGSSKLPRFLQKQSTRDRSKSVNDGPGSSPEIPATPSSKHPRKGSKFTGVTEDSAPTDSEETPVIIEPVPIPSPRLRQRSDRPTSSEIPSSSYTSTSPSRIGDLPTRLSGWFSHTFSSSSTDLTLPTIIAQSHSPIPSNSVSTGSPRNRLSGASALLTAAKHGKGHLDKAMRYLLDSDATPDKCSDPIWLLGVQHTGYEPPQTQQFPPSAFPGSGGSLGRRGSIDARSAHAPSSSSYSSDQSSSYNGHKRSRSRGQHASSASSSSHSNPNSHFLSQSQPASSSQPPSISSSVSSTTATPSVSVYNPNSSTASTNSVTNKDVKHPGANWPEVFYADFTSRVWLTYRSHFTPIRDVRLGDLAPPACEPLMGPRASSGVSSLHNPASPSTFSTSSAASRRTPSRYTTDSYKSDSSLSTSLSNTSSSRGPGSPTSTVTSRKWGWGGALGGLGGEKGWTSDSGWGCMLRTGQSLLANALLFMHLGREWRKPPNPEMTREYAMYVQIVTWFLDTPAEQAPFSVHRMALAGKELGKDVGMWFGPSTAAGAIKTLVHAYPDAGMGVSVATDGTLYQTDVYAASHGASSSSYPRRGKGIHTAWGDRPVLLLLGIRLGLDGVNPIYYDTIKLLYTFPQSVGIAGGRPSSSYYFVGSQADNLFYLDPHHARPAVPLRPPPSSVSADSELHPPFSRGGSGSTGGTTDDGGDEREKDKDKDKDKDKKKRVKKEKHQPRSSSGGSITSASSSGSHQTTPASPSSVRTGSSFHAPLSPSPLQQQYSRSSSAGAAEGSAASVSASTSSSSHAPSRNESPVAHPFAAGDMDMSELMGTAETAVPLDHGLTPVEEHYVTAYSVTELKTFHCERVRKMPMSGLDPSMLIGFLCRDEKDWVDFRRRVGELPKTIFSVQDEPPTWAADSDDNMALESLSDPDEIDLDSREDGETNEDGDSEDPNISIESGTGQYTYYDSRSRSASLSLSSASQHEESTGGVDTEEDPVDPITPGPTPARFDIRIPKGLEDAGSGARAEGENVDDDDDIEDDWVEPSLPSSPVRMSPPPPPPGSAAAHQTQIPSVIPVPALSKSRTVSGSGSSGSGSTTKNSKKKGKGKTSKHQQQGQTPVPVPKVKIPSPRESFPFPVAPEEEGLDAEGMSNAYSYSYSYSSSSEMSGDGGPGGSIGRDGWGEGKEVRMHTARARDGGRTQSGGVKGVLTDDWVV